MDLDKSQGWVNFKGLCGRTASDFLLLLDFRAQGLYSSLPQLGCSKFKWGFRERPQFPGKEFYIYFNVSRCLSVASTNPNLLRKKSESLGKEKGADTPLLIYVPNMGVAG